MKYFFHFVLVWLSLVAAVSCASKKPAEPVMVTKTKTIKEIVKDTVYRVEADSSFYKAYINCVNGQPVVGETIQKQSGKYLQPPKVQINSAGLLKIDCTSEAQKLFKSWKQTYIQEQEPVIVKVPEEVYVEKPYPWYVKLQIWCGRVLLLIILSIVIYQILQLKWKR